jgi:hypothetical protein
LPQKNINTLLSVGAYLVGDPAVGHCSRKGAKKAKAQRFVATAFESLPSLRLCVNKPPKTLSLPTLKNLRK